MGSGEDNGPQREQGAKPGDPHREKGQEKGQEKVQLAKEQEALKDKVGDDPHEDVGRWGLFCCSPSWMQWVNRPQIVIFCLCWFYLLQGFTVNGVNNVNTSTLERRFGLPSSRVSLISSSYDIMAGLCVLPITFLCARAHYPRMLGMAGLVMSAGSLVMSLPHFTSPPYDLVGSVADKCDLAGNGTDALCTKDQGGLSNYLYIFMLGQFLHGIGGAILYSIGVVYIDDNVTTESSPLYNGFIFACSALGPAIGYIVGGQMLQVFVDFDRVDTSRLGLTPEDPRWVGAWWVCFFVASFLFLTVFLFFIPYPKDTINAPIVRQQRVSMAHDDGSEVIVSRDGFGVSVRDLPMAIWLLVKNPVNMLVTLGGVTEGLLTSGFATFMPKFLQNQYGLTAGTAAMLGGFMSVPGAAGGQFLGGLICKVFKLKVRGLVRLCLCLSVACSLCGFSLLINCGPEPVAGVSVKYGNRSIKISDNELTNQCNMECNCVLRSYEPVCGTDSVQYFSPCHAGCRNSYKKDGKKLYTDCSCIPAANETVVVAVQGKCPTSCSLVWVFLPFFFAICLLTFCGTVPGVVASLRCVPNSQRPLAFGVKWVFIRFLGTVPGPLLFGLLYDNTCVLWQEKCSQKGSCWIYDNQQLSLSLFLFCLCIKTLSSVFFLGANLCYRPPPSEQAKDNAGFSDEASGGATITESTAKLTPGSSTEGEETRL